MKAALAKAAGYIAANSFEIASKRCACGAPIESWQTLCKACVAAEVAAVVVANSKQWLAEGDCARGAGCFGSLCADFPFAPDCPDLTAAPASAPAAKMAAVEKILSATQGRRSRPNPVFFVEAGDLCYTGK